MREFAHPAIRQALKPVRRRVHISQALMLGSMGVLAASVSFAALALASYFIPIPQLHLWMGAAAFGILLLAVIAGLLRPVSYKLAARCADAGGLKERVLTALTIMDDTPMAQLLREDAIRHLKSLPLKTAIPLKAGKTPLIMATIVALLAAGLVMFVPNPQNDVLAGREAFAKAMEKQAKAVEEALEKLEEAPYTKEELSALRKLMGDLAREIGKSTEPQQAYLAMDKAQRELSELQKTAADRMRLQAAQAFSQSGLTDLSNALSLSDASAAQKAAAQLSNAGANAAGSNALKQAADAMPEGELKEAASKTAEALKTGDMENVKAALSSLSAAMQSTCSGSSPGNSGNLGDINSLLAQLRSATLSASQESSGQAAGSGKGSASGQGKGNGQGTGSGQGQQGGAGAGKGSTNLDGGITKPGTSSQGQGANVPEYKLSQYETIYDPTRLSGADELHQTAGSVGEGESQQIQLGPGLGDASGQVPYHEVIFSYQDAASKAAQLELLPEGMQLWVDGYFQSLID